MIGIEYIVAFSMAIVNIGKKYLPSNVVPIATVATTIIINLINALIFDGDLRLAGQEAFIASGIAAGLFAAGDAIRKCPKNPIKDKR